MSYRFSQDMNFGILLLSSLLTPINKSIAFAQPNLTPFSWSQDSRTKALESLKRYTTTITFSKDSATLSEAERGIITSAVNSAKTTGSINRVIVAAWSDRDYPAVKGASLKDKDIDIAKARIASIKHVLDTLDIKQIETHTMTENPNWFGRLFNTVDTKVKGVGKLENLDDQMLDDIGNTIRDRGGIGKAVIIIRYDGDNYVH